MGKNAAKPICTSPQRRPQMKGCVIMSVVHVTESTFQKEVMESPVPVLLDFWAPWCGPCQMLTPIMEELAAEHPEYKICKVNVDEEMALAKQFRVFSIPSLFVMKNGQIVNKSVGARPKNQILAMMG